MTRLGFRVGLVAILMSVVLTQACSTSVEGSAFDEGYRAWVTIGNIKTGDEWVLLLGSLKNRLAEPVVLRKIDLTGEGVGEVVAVKRIQIATSAPDQETVVGGVYTTYPPVEGVESKGGTSCHRQRLVPVAGFRMEPEEEVRISVLLEARDSGRVRIDAHVVTYEEAGSQVVQVIPTGMRAKIADDAKGIALRPHERPCLSMTRDLVHDR